MVHLTRRYRFAAAHRLHSNALSGRENAETYGKCNNPYGHGHNYVLDVTVAGPVNPATGMVFDLSMLDLIVQREILERLDHTHLNLDVDLFRSVVPTTENLCVEVYKLLREKLTFPGRETWLERVRLEETNSNYFEYDG